MNKVAVMHRDMNEEQRWPMETSRERLPECAEIAMDLQISVRHRDDYVHEFIGSELPNIAIKRLLGRSRSAMDNWRDDIIMKYYFSLLAHTASLQSISSLVNGDAITEGKEWKIDRDFIHDAILPVGKLGTAVFCLKNGLSKRMISSGTLCFLSFSNNLYRLIRSKALIKSPNAITGVLPSSIFGRL